MGWLVNLVVTAILSAVIIVKIFDVIFHGILGPVTSAAKTGIFVSVGTAVTTSLGMLGFRKAVRDVRQANKEVGERINLLPKDKQLK